jgi:periplasmic protein TonB
MFKELEVSSLGVALVLLALIAIVVGLILYYRNKYRSYSYQSLRESNVDYKAKGLGARTKFPEVDVFKNSGSFFNLGMTAAVAIALVTMSWTSYEKAVFIPDGALVFDDEVEVDIPRTAEPPPPQPPKTVEDEIFKVVEQMPRFPGCEDKGTDKEKDDCAKGKMLEYIYKNLKYPAIARENGVEGQAVLQFVVDKDGSITDVKIARDPGAGCGAAAESVILSMNNMGKKWTPGKQRGRAVKVLYTLPVKFKLEG